MARLKDYMNFTAWFAGLGYGLLWLFAGAALPPALHGVGLVALIFVGVRLLLIVLHRVRPRPARNPKNLPTPLWRAHVRPPSLPQVKPRSHFGLRGTPR